jgi:hypothetical protein
VVAQDPTDLFVALMRGYCTCFGVSTMDSGLLNTSRALIEGRCS